QRGEEHRVDEDDRADQDEQPPHDARFLPVGGPVWGTESDDLNATILEWASGEGTPEHVNAERDVALVVLAGTGELLLGGAPRAPRGTAGTTDGSWRTSTRARSCASGRGSRCACCSPSGGRG